ncbi:hypothetical protein AGDE_17206 [Angomonas deanei]|uniref:Uncharacterized protein n=1 Tax=Angomonas deanei TaxID=59799 RepID=A0A7G2CGL8_9TRYP|nr:hypothetical protein AGDE_17206 [Angomonas deanei]CAD2218495.1 hypothetical protein, conserved [Angomonas deanei]|eukprot:EPY15048.1 hypothetical protein AGDE_17206 [Angomonas deanei]
MNSTSTSGMSPGNTFLANLDRRADSSVSKSKQMLKEQENTNNNHTNATDNNNMNPNHNNAANATHNSANKHENSEKKKKKSHGQASPLQYYEIDRMRLHDYIHGLHEVEMLYKSGLLTSDEDFLQMGLVYAIPGVRALSTGEVLAFSRSLWNKARSSKSTSSNSEVVERLMDDGTRIVPPSGKVMENTADTSDSSNGGHPAVPRPPLLLPLLEGGESRPVKAADFTVFKGLVEKKLKEVEVHLGENELPDME